MGFAFDFGFAFPFVNIKVNAQISKEGNKSLLFTYQIEDGADTESDYGIELAVCAFFLFLSFLF
jgi:hypothetical protein